ncbi:hypothetical protein ERS070154_00447 [Streptococcus pneumoniae]|nr:hypothetical protein ERS070154_00447 [Streptococcus pneumoniae]
MYIYADIVNAKTGQIPRKDTFNERFDRSSVPITKQGWTNFANVPDGEYYLQFHGEDDYRSVLYKFIGKSATFTVKDQKYVNPLDSSTPKETEKPTATETSKPATNSSSGQTGWAGSSYYKAGVKVVNQWIFDVQYNSYFYLNASGNFVQNAWSGSYYLKSGGYMAKSEWIYDNNYQSYYYLTAEGSYARNAWSGSYYLKSDGKMAVNERTPDGYKVDGSGKWVR